ncbi:hypothetical protein J4456_00160 [Candidatus Pacearchaeota archaeon]|nr:hypothetical protein [Candidatus Pacearchaeota archaeon]
MKLITHQDAEARGLKKIGSIIEEDMSKVILMIERLKENKKIEYYSADLILFDEVNHVGNIEISFWR